MSPAVFWASPGESPIIRAGVGSSAPRRKNNQLPAEIHGGGDVGGNPHGIQLTALQEEENNVWPLRETIFRASLTAQ